MQTAKTVPANLPESKLCLMLVGTAFAISSPSTHCVRDRGPVNLPPFYLGKEARGFKRN